jgi:hypothetical protein
MIFRAGRCGGFEPGDLLLAHRLALHDEAVTVMHQPVEDGVSDGPIADVGVPLVQGQLARDHRGTSTAMTAGPP